MKRDDKTAWLNRDVATLKRKLKAERAKVAALFREIANDQTRWMRNQEQRMAQLGRQS